MNLTRLILRSGYVPFDHDLHFKQQASCLLALILLIIMQIKIMATSQRVVLIYEQVYIGYLPQDNDYAALGIKKKKKIIYHGTQLVSRRS